MSYSERNRRVQSYNKSKTNNNHKANGMKMSEIIKAGRKHDSVDKMQNPISKYMYTGCNFLHYSYSNGEKSKPSNSRLIEKLVIEALTLSQILFRCDMAAPSS